MKRFLALCTVLLFFAGISQAASLRVSKATAVSVTLDWTAPGDDGNIGTASQYQMRYNINAPSDTTEIAKMNWFNAATDVTGLPTPLIAGTTQSVVVNGLNSGITYYFLMRTADEVPNWSLLSNLASKLTPDTIPPSKVIDLRTR